MVSVATPLSFTIRKLNRWEPSSTAFEFQVKDQSWVPTSRNSSSSPRAHSPLSTLYSSRSCSSPSTVPENSTVPSNSVPTAGPARVTIIRARLTYLASSKDSSPSSLIALARISVYSSSARTQSELTATSRYQLLTSPPAVIHP